VSDPKADFVKVNVVGVRVEMPTNQPIILLQDEEGDRYLPIWVGAVEATAIAFAQQGIKPPRPLTHDLFTDVLITLQVKLVEVRITSLTDGVFFAEIEFGGGQVLSSRPSDAIALALRNEASIFVAEDVLAAAGIDIPVEEEDQLDKFREFLDQVKPEDFNL
jgi:bifunctional DNase/RNase